jgi:hypothetical protein
MRISARALLIAAIMLPIAAEAQTAAAPLRMRGTLVRR